MSKQIPGPSAHISVDMVRVPNRNFGYQTNSQHMNHVANAPKSDFAYINAAYVGSTNSVNENRLQQPPVTVIREQYWACSKWPFMTRILVIAVGLLLGAVIGLSIIIAMDREDHQNTNIFRTQPAPD
ncbi:uncharacterized protein LOC112049321 [Bicyclus anynana]|uniref:Uncharacterized protein LOC112049321 n=1 Tax=Bicyclus anynana TaxID=110368 RepID=A0A6J1N7T1_BICAN|nr:uncharacterized protein LOC112049321 [Bicyclus anynana]